MANYGGFNFTGFRGVNLKNTAIIRAESEGFATTISIKEDAEAAYALKLPLRSGTLPVHGTFAVNLPAVTSWGETMVTISGLRAEDALTCAIQKTGSTVTTGRTLPLIAAVKPENGYAYLTFYNPTGTATLYSDLVLSYVVSR